MPLLLNLHELLEQLKPHGIVLPLHVPFNLQHRGGEEEWFVGTQAAMKGGGGHPLPTGLESASASSSCNSQRVPELPTEHVQEFKVVWTRRQKFHTVPVEGARAQR